MGGAEIGNGCGEQRGVGGEGVEKEVIEERGEESGGAELVPQVKRQGSLQRRVGEYRRVEVAGQSRFGLGVAARLGFDLGPHPRLALDFGGRLCVSELAGWHLIR